MSMFSSRKAASTSLGAPDVCQVPGASTAPLPYPNMSNAAQAEGMTDKVQVEKN